MPVKLRSFIKNQACNPVHKFLFIILLLCFLPVGLVIAQSAEEEEVYTREFTYGINFNSNGGLIGGAMIKQAFHLQGKWYHFWALEGVEVKHPKEVRFQNPYTGATFVNGKSNYLFVLRPQYGREYTFFRKAAESGVQVNGVAAVGPSIGVLAPYYIDYNHNQNAAGPVEIRTEPYNPDVHTDAGSIVGSSGVFMGLAEPSFKFGANIKAGVSFEYGRYMESVTGIEVGMLYEMFTDKIILIPKAENRNQFMSVYLTLYYGHRR